MILPTIHSNGTSAERLGDAYERAYDAVQAAYEALRETAPNGRDYYVQDDAALSRATAEHNARLERLHSVMLELDVLVGHCDRRDFGGPVS